MILVTLIHALIGWCQIVSVEIMLQISLLLTKHRIIKFNFKKPRNTKSRVIKKKIPIYTDDSVNQFCSSLDSEILPCSHDFYSFVSSTLLLHNSTFSFKTITSPAVNCGPNFLSFKYCNKAAERDSTLRSYQHTNDPRTLDKFKSLRKQCNRIAVDDKRTYLSSEINKYRYSDPLKMWRVLNIFFNNHNQLPSFMTISNEKVTDAEVIAYSFNNYFLFCDI